MRTPRDRPSRDTRDSRATVDVHLPPAPAFPALSAQVTSKV